MESRAGPCQFCPERVASALFRGRFRWVLEMPSGFMVRGRRECAPVAQLDRASDYESEGRTFESFRARHFGTELGTPKPVVFALEAATSVRISGGSKTIRRTGRRTRPRTPRSRPR